MLMYPLIAVLLLSPTEKEVFNTDQFRDEQVYVTGKQKHVFVARTRCDTSQGPPYSCKTTLYFFRKKFQPISIYGTAYRFASVDINLDGQEELITLSQISGMWREINVFGRKFNKEGTEKWYEPVATFSWYPGYGGERGCVARIFWLKEKEQIKTVSTNGASESFDCTNIKTAKWAY